MKKIIHHKLVRDRIPEIIEASGNTCATEILSDEEYLRVVDAKLDEELAEYHKDQNLEELADLLEVIHAATLRAFWIFSRTLLTSWIFRPPWRLASWCQYGASASIPTLI